MDRPFCVVRANASRGYALRIGAATHREKVLGRSLCNQSEPGIE